MHIRNRVLGCGQHSSGLGQKPLAGHCVLDNEPRDSSEGGEFKSSHFLTSVFIVWPSPLAFPFL
jgi:hypothetical protein